MVRFPIIVGISLLVISLESADADDTELFVVNLPDDAQPNVLLIMDTSGSMAGAPIVAARAAADSFLASAENINISLMSFNWDPNEGGPSGGRVDFASENIDTGRTEARNIMSNTNAVQQISTPLSETLYEAYRYFGGLSPRFGFDTSASQFDINQSVADSISAGDYVSPIVNSCQNSNIILFTDGGPGNDNRADTDIRSLVSSATLPAGLSKTCTGSGAATNCVDELAWYMRNNDINADLGGDQNIRTHTIGFSITAGARNLMINVANHGGGQYYDAVDASSIEDAFDEILLRVNTEDSTFASPATSTSAFNSLETAEDVYYIMFRPDVGPGWTGNLKRYRLGDDNQIYDANGDPAIDPATGYFYDTAQSFWSTSADGKSVGLGGMASQLTQTRPLYTNLSGSVNITLNASGNMLHENTLGITAAMLADPAPEDTERKNILKWARGVDIDDSDSDGSTIDNRTSIGDPLHAQPQIVTYFKNSDGTVVDKTIFFTTNDGFLHAVNTEDGSTEFGYIPQELLKNLKIYRDGFVSGGTVKIYGLDGPMTVWVNDENNDGDVLQADNGTPDTGEHVYLYLSMRRGGNNIYALDVTRRNNPILKWMIRGDLDNDHLADNRSTNPDFFELGQTWSAPKLAQVRWNGTDRKVLFFGGGYDLDADNQSTIADNNIGRAIYMVDAETGALLWRAGQSGVHLNLAAMKYSIPAELTLVDIDQDGNIDFFFAADIGGQLFRFDINQANTSASNFATGGVIARLSGSSAANARRFFEAPDVVIGNNSDYLDIAIGSGTRPHPLSTDVNDRVYVIRDPNVYNPPTSYNYDGSSVITESSLYDATDNLIQQGTDTQQNSARASLLNSNGWMVRLEVSGEKILGRTRVFRGVLLFNSFAPRSSETFTCGPQAGQNFFYALDIENASSVFNLDTVDTATELNKNDRRLALRHSSLAPTPSILSRGGQGAEVCVGTECFQNTLRSIGSVPMNRNFWLEKR